MFQILNYIINRIDLMNYHPELIRHFQINIIHSH
jgi:hypothetical protein